MNNSTQANAELMRFDGKPSWGAAFPQAMQHVLAMLIGNITPPMLIAGICGLSPEEQIMLTQAAMIIGGITTLLQLFPVFGFGMKPLKQITISYYHTVLNITRILYRLIQSYHQMLY